MTLSIWQGLSDEMDAVVDANLADQIRYSIRGAPFRTLAGYVEFDNPSLSIDEIDELATRPRLKIAKALIDKPVQMDRIQCTARLGSATYRPVGKAPREQGRYWIIDIQKVTP